MKKIWLQEEEQLEEKQQEKELRRKLEEEDDATNKGIYDLVVKLNRDSSIEIVRLDSIEPL